MQDLIISINDNILRLSTIDQDASLKTASLKLPEHVLKDSDIIDPEALAKETQGVLSSVTSLDRSKLSLNFVIQPEDVYLRFVTVSKSEQDLELYIVREIKEKLDGVSIDNLYYSYQKIAPFLYQFIGVKKEKIESYLDISNFLGIGLKSIIPWVLALPKYVKVSEPSIFVSKVEDGQVIALSELNGVFFSGVYKKEQSDSDIQKLVQDLAFYKRSSPINKVFTLNCDAFELKGYQVTPIALPQFKDGSDVPVGFEQNVIVNYLIDTRADLLLNQVNVLNLLPLPVIESRKTSLVAVGGLVAAVLLVGVFYGGYLLFKDKGVPSSNELAQNVQEETSSVLSESTANEITQQVIVEVNKEDIRITVENGSNLSGIASKTKELLEGLGYKVLSIGTSEEKVSNTVLRFKKDYLEEYESLVRDDLDSVFPEIEIQDTLDSDSEYDLLIIVGSNNNL